MNISEFQTKWRGVTLNERQSAVPHFESLRHLLGHPTPTEMDPEGRFFACEKGLGKASGGIADVLHRRHFGSGVPECHRQGGQVRPPAARRCGAAAEQFRQQVRRDAVDTRAACLTIDRSNAEGGAVIVLPRADG